MAASCREKDYCHILETILREYNDSSTVIGYNVSEFEIDPLIGIDTLLNSKIVNADIIVLRIGENVKKEKLEIFEKRLDDFIKYCKRFTSNILITGNFWHSTDKNSILLNAAFQNNLEFVPISWIATDEKSYPHIGDSILATTGETYQITQKFIITHPNDYGMELIAKAIFNGITRMPINTEF